MKKLFVIGSLCLLSAFSCTAQNDKPSPTLEKGVKFLADNKTNEGVVTTESGLQYRIIKEGEGVMVKCLIVALNAASQLLLV